MWATRRAANVRFKIAAKRLRGHVCCRPPTSWPAPRACGAGMRADAMALRQRAARIAPVPRLGMAAPPAPHGYGRAWDMRASLSRWRAVPCAPRPSLTMEASARKQGDAEGRPRRLGHGAARHDPVPEPAGGPYKPAGSEEEECAEGGSTAESWREGWGPPTGVKASGPRGLASNMLVRLTS